MEQRKEREERKEVRNLISLDDDGPNPEKVNFALEAYMESLQQRIVAEEERQDRAKDDENELWNDEVGLGDDFKSLRKETKEITTDLKR